MTSDAGLGQPDRQPAPGRAGPTEDSHVHRPYLRITSLVAQWDSSTGKRLLITGVLTDASLAFAVARLAQEEGAEIVLSGRRARPSR